MLKIGGAFFRNIDVWFCDKNVKILRVDDPRNVCLRNCTSSGEECSVNLAGRHAPVLYMGMGELSISHLKLFLLLGADYHHCGCSQ